MPNRYKPNCATCTMSKKNVPLRRRIRYAAYKRETGDETLQDIANEIGVGQASIYNHVKKHMEDISDKYIDRSRVQAAKKVAEVRAKVQEEMELTLESDAYDQIEGRPLEIVALDDYIAQGKAMIDNKEIKINATSFLTAVKIKNDWAKGQASTKLDFLKAVYAYASNDKKEQGKYEPSDDTGQDAGGDEAGEKQPDSVYRAVVGSDTP